MPSKIWNKYQLLEEISTNSKIKTYLARIEPIIKEIIPKNKNEYNLIREKLEIIKNIIKIYEIAEENDRIYIVIDNNKEEISKLDKLILSDELNPKNEGFSEEQGKPISKNELIELFKMEKSMCKISYEKLINNEIKKEKGTGFFCEINDFPIKYVLFTNNHVLNKNDIKLGNIINIEYLNNSSYIGKQIKIDDKRRSFTNEKLDYTCIELMESDGINNYKDYFKIDPNILNNKNYLNNSDVFILLYPSGKELSFSYGKILYLKDNEIYLNSSTEKDLSGSLIIRRSKDNFIIGLYSGGIRKEKNLNSFNLAISFDLILNDINKPNEINCIYKLEDNKNEIQLLYDYNDEVSKWNQGEDKKLYLEAKEVNPKIYKENTELYINDKKMKFDYNYKVNEDKEIKVKFKFKKNFTNISLMFMDCSSLKSIDLSSFNGSNITNMNGMFSNCSSLESIDLSSFDTSKVTHMGYMFWNCTSLKSINLCSFNTSNVANLGYMFFYCSSLKSIDLSSFNASNVTNMSCMFKNCSSLQSIDLSSFNTSNAINMSGMFYECSSLESIDLSSFNTKKVSNMTNMFWNCSSIKSIDLSSFNTINVKSMRGMFGNCYSLKSLDLTSFNTSNVVKMTGMFNNCSYSLKKNIGFNKKDKKLLYEINHI